MVEKPKILPPIYFFAALLVMAGLHSFFPIARIVPSPFNYTGAALVVLGAASTLWAAMFFGKVGTPVKPFEQSTVLVTAGLYRITRNPMYLGLVLALIGVALLLGSASPFLIIPVFVWWIRRRFVLREETFLEAIFGQEYRSYKTRVRRWL
jgi:protein-S-isoprenylcysteine O-methyltransferase Ste14